MSDVLCKPKSPGSGTYFTRFGSGPNLPDPDWLVGSRTMVRSKVIYTLDIPHLFDHALANVLSKQAVKLMMFLRKNYDFRCV